MKQNSKFESIKEWLWCRLFELRLWYGWFRDGGRVPVTSIKVSLDHDSKKDEIFGYPVEIVTLEKAVADGDIVLGDLSVYTAARKKLEQ